LEESLCFTVLLGVEFPPQGRFVSKKITGIDHRFIEERNMRAQFPCLHISELLSLVD